MNTPKKTILCAALISALLPSAVRATITAINNGSHEWPDAPWTAGEPNPVTTVFLNANAWLIVPESIEATVDGFRVGNENTENTTLMIDGGSLESRFVVLGDSANGNATFLMESGTFVTHETERITDD